MSKDYLGQYMVTKITEGEADISKVIDLIFAHIQLHPIYFYHEPYFHEDVLLTSVVGYSDQLGNFVRTINKVAEPYNCKIECLLLKDYAGGENA